LPRLDIKNTPQGYAAMELSSLSICKRKILTT